MLKGDVKENIDELFDIIEGIRNSIGVLEERIATIEGAIEVQDELIDGIHSRLSNNGIFV